MSHFTVLVATKSPADVSAALQPFHEYECTGVKDQYVRFVPAPETEAELRAMHSNHLEKYPDSTRQDFGQWIDSEFGYELRDGVWGRETNPDKQWDWWVVGGRWSNKLLLKNGSHCDQAIKGDIDFDGMLAGEVAIAEREYDKAASIIQGETFEAFDMLRERMEPDIDGARKAYWDQPAVKRLTADDDFRFHHNLESFLLQRNDYVRKMSRSAFCTFALLHNGKWNERGDMGWWASVSDDKGDRWPDEFYDILASVPQDHWLTVVDCHI